MNVNDTLWNGAGRRIHMQEVGTARRPADRRGLRADRRQDRAGRRAVARRHGEDRGHVLRLAARRSRRCATPRSCCARSSAGPAWSTARWCPTCAAPSAPSTRAPTSSTSSCRPARRHNLANLRMTREQSFAALSRSRSRWRGRPRCRSTSRSPAPSAARWKATCPWPRCSTGAPASSTSWARAASRCATPPAWPIPAQVAALTAAFRERWPDTELTLHFHNTRGMGLANVLAAIDAGADRFDASLGGIGGCPYAPGATRQRVQRGDRARARTDGLRHRRRPGAADRRRRSALPALIGHDIPSQIVKAGRRLDLHPVPADFAAIRERALARAI